MTSTCADVLEGVVLGGGREEEEGAGAVSGKGEEELRRGGGGYSLRSCPSGESLTAASDAGDTDFADQTASEVGKNRGVVMCVEMRASDTMIL